ncbi:MAG: hypothetical protein L0Y71_13485 [Gemmataceae bacterium]|nr:hypothetical protein [Gemmataceae bacterium]
MEMIVFKCTSCQSSLKFGKDKAGRKVSCPNCGADLRLPESADGNAAPGGEDEAGGYKIAFVDDEAERAKREEAQAKKAVKKEVMRIKVRRKNIGDLDVWAKVNNGYVFLMVGACIWGGAYALQMLVVFLGMIQGPELGVNAEKFLFPPGQRPLEVGAAPDMNKPMFFLSMVSGSDFAGTAQVLMIVAQVLTLIQAVMWMIGYGMCLPVEDRLGTRGQLISLFALGGTNVLLNLFFRFLPLVGAIGYVLVPLFAPEIVMAEVNTERSRPIHVSWCHWPVVEIFLTVLVQACLLMEPIMIGVFTWTVAQILRDDPLEVKAFGVVKLGFGVLFMILAYHMYACAGTSSVLIKLERVIYILWFAFQIGMIVRLATTCHRARELFAFYLRPDE